VFDPKRKLTNPDVTMVWRLCPRIADQGVSARELRRPHGRHPPTLTAKCSYNNAELRLAKLNRMFDGREANDNY